MKRILIPAIAFFAALVLFPSLPTSTQAGEVALKGAEVGKWTMDFDAALELAGKKDLPILLNFTGSDWCGWCKLMDKQVFAEQAWKDFAKDSVVLVTIDFPRNPETVPDEYVKRNQTLQQAFGIQGYPTYVVLDSDGRTLLGRLGAAPDATPASFQKEFAGVTKFSSGSLGRFAKTLPEDKRKDFEAALEELKTLKADFEKWLAGDPVMNEENDKTFKGFQERMVKALARIEAFFPEEAEDKTGAPAATKE